jgi:hypothetical protein
MLHRSRVLRCPNRAAVGPPLRAESRRYRADPPATVSPGDPSHDNPFFATDVDLAGHGYVEEEFFFEGTANKYNIPANVTVTNTPMTTAAVTGSAPYKTRMIVRRPANPAEFNGTVIMEWLNVTFLYDLDAVWLACSERLMRRGYAYIGVSAQYQGIHSKTGLRAWSAARYGTLDVTNGGALVPQDSLQYDIFSQAGQAVRNPMGIDPMAGFNVQQIIAVGLSQGAVRLVAYHNAVHPLAGVFDGFMPYFHGGLVRTDLPDDVAVKVFKVLTETDVWRDQATLRQPNSDRFHRWEVAGASHIDFQAVETVKPLLVRDGLSAWPEGICNQQYEWSHIPMSYVANAAIEAMVGWVWDNIRPPEAPDIEVVTIGTPVGAYSVIARDADGNALGGIRLSQHAVPTATNTGENAPVTSACRTYGSFAPFTQARLAELYPNHGVYVSRVAHITGENLAGGFIVPEDAEATIQAAAESSVGKR